ncbi:MAG TPA: hypothetical protein VGF98_07415 [Candidatus Tumulicola sp.]
MRLTFSVAGQLDFSKYQYSVTFNTTGSALTPEFGTKADWKAFSATFRSMNGSGAPSVEVIQYISDPNDPHQPPAQVPEAVTPSQLQFDARSSTFSVTFQRSIAGDGSQQPAVNWRFNASSQTASHIVDTMGRCASCFKSPQLAVNTSFVETIAAQGQPDIAPGARIVSVEFQNSP